MPSLRQLKQERDLLDIRSKELFLSKERARISREQEAEPDPSLIDQVVGGAETVARIGSGILAEPIAGLAGLGTGAALTTGRALGLTDEGTDIPAAVSSVVEQVRGFVPGLPGTTVSKESMESIAGSEAVQALGKGMKFLEKAFGDVGLDIQGPELAAVMSAIPTGAIEGLGLALPGALSKVTGQLGRASERRAQRLSGEVQDLRAPGQEAGLRNVSESLAQGDIDDLSSIVRPDNEFFQALDELNINVEPLASFSSQNPLFRTVEQALASVPASQLDAQTKIFIKSVSEKADNLITQYGGTRDKAGLSDRFRASSFNTIDDLAVQADELYNQLAARIPPGTLVDATNTSQFLTQKIDALGGRSKSASFLKSVLNQIKTTEKTGPSSGILDASGRQIPGQKTFDRPTHEALSQTRKEIGQAIGKRSGPFKDAETGLLKAIYKRLRQDQDAVARSAGLADVSDAANGLVRQRKQLESNLTRLLGKDLQGSILPVVGNRLRKLSKGDVQRWDNTMDQIKDPAIRQEIVVSSLNDIFTGGRSGSLNPTQFSKFMDDLNTQPAARSRLYKELPPESIRALNNLHKISKGISVALGDRVPTGRLAEFFKQKSGILKNLVGTGAEAAIRTGGFAFGRSKFVTDKLASVTKDFINQVTDGAKSAAEVLASPQFSSMLRVAAREGFVEGSAITGKLAKAEKAFERSATFRRWTDTLSNSQRARLLSVGTAGYLLGNLPEGEEDDDQ